MFRGLGAEFLTQRGPRDVSNANRGVHGGGSLLRQTSTNFLSQKSRAASAELLTWDPVEAVSASAEYAEILPKHSREVEVQTTQNQAYGLSLAQY